MKKSAILSLLASSLGLFSGLSQLGCGSSDAPLKDPSENAPKPIASTSASAPLAPYIIPQEKQKAQSPAPAASPFSIFYEQDFTGLMLHPMGKIAGVIVGSGYFNTLFAVDSSGLRSDIDMLKGLPGHTGAPPPKDEENPPVFSIYTVSGDWPKSGTIYINTPGDRGGTDYVYQLKDGTWINDKAAVEHSQTYWNAYYLGGLLSGTPWKTGAIYEITGEDGRRFIFEGKPKSTPVPRMAPVAKPNKADENACVHQFALHIALGGTKAGDLFGLGQLCKDGEAFAMPWAPTAGELAVERWSAGKQDSIVEKLPNGMIRANSEHSNDFGLELRSASDVYVYANVSPDGTEKDLRPYLAHFDGKQWSEIKPPEPGGFISKLFLREADKMIWVNVNDRMYRRAFVGAEEKSTSWERMTPDVHELLRYFEFGPDGTFWARFGNRLYRRPGGSGNWEETPMPTKTTKDQPATFLPKHLVFWDDDVFVISDLESEGADASIATALLRLKKTASLNTHIKKPEGKEPSALVKPAGPSCKDVFVVLYKLAKTAPADFDFPLTREALKGRTEFSKAEFAETIDGGRRYFVAFTPSFDMGRKLSKVIAEKVKGSTPQLMCGKPKVSRSLKLDLKTGNLLK